MYVINPSAVKSKLFYCTEALGKELIKIGLSLFSRKSGFYVFVDDKKLRSALKNVNFLMKFFSDMTVAGRRTEWEES